MQRMMIDWNTGNVGIGTSSVNDAAYKLFVETGIRTRKVKVDAPSVAWPDYVFDDDYPLPSLKEVALFIEKNKHLQGVLSAAQAKKEGVDLGENQAALLQKIEELTLYCIQQDKKSAMQQQQIESLNEQLAAIKKLLEQKK